MNDKPNPTRNFLISLISAFLSDLLKPLWYVMRSDMGIQHTALIPVILSGLIYGVGFSLLSLTGAVNRQVIMLYAVLIVAGYIRNTLQARRRRRVRDWSVNTWSSGESLFVPVLLFTCRRLYRRWGNKPYVRRLVGAVLREDFIYYIAEPVTMLFAAIALRSIDSTLFYYPIILAIALVVFRNDAQLWLYLKAHEIPDGKRMERAVKSELEGPAQSGGSGSLVAQIPDAPRMRFATDDRSVFDRLSPELQSLLLKDRFGHSQTKA